MQVALPAGDGVCGRGHGTSQREASHANFTRCSSMKQFRSEFLFCGSDELWYTVYYQSVIIFLRFQEEQSHSSHFETFIMAIGYI